MGPECVIPSSTAAEHGAARPNAATRHATRTLTRCKKVHILLGTMTIIVFCDTILIYVYKT